MVDNLKHFAVTSFGDCEKLLDEGLGNRTVGSTAMNASSSRSHCVFTLALQQLAGTKAESKITLIDLAGSERSDKLGSVGKQLQEGNNINKSLTVLGRCIKALDEAARAKASGKGKAVVVPFRESVLTFYLRESLAGNAKTTMLANIR